LISKYRPKAPIYAFAASHPVCARLNLLWGVQPVWCYAAASAEDMVLQAERLLLKKHAVQPGDVVAVVAGTSTTSGSTNFLRLHVVKGGRERMLEESDHRVIGSSGHRSGMRRT
jgi:pyruvate kinase